MTFSEGTGVSNARKTNNRFGPWVLGRRRTLEQGNSLVFGAEGREWPAALCTLDYAGLRATPFGILGSKIFGVSRRHVSGARPADCIARKALSVCLAESPKNSGLLEGGVCTEN
jgi:hypothetical protein